MTDDELKADRALCEAATPGPFVTAIDGRRYEIRTIAARREDGQGQGERLARGIERCPDAEMLAAARTRWPAALDEIERLRSRLAEVEAERDRLLTVSQQLQEDRDRVLGERDAARDEVERLRTRCAELEAHPRWSVHGSSASDIIAERDRLRAERDGLAGLLPYVEHCASCLETYRCNCGLDERLEAAIKAGRHDIEGYRRARPTLKATGEGE